MQMHFPLLWLALCTAPMFCNPEAHMHRHAGGVRLDRLTGLILDFYYISDISQSALFTSDVTAVMQLIFEYAFEYVCAASGCDVGVDSNPEF